MRNSLIVAVLTLVIYANSLYGRFVFDDLQLITQNPELINVRSLHDVFSLLGGSRQLLTILRSDRPDWRWAAPLAAAPLVFLAPIGDELTRLYETVTSNTVLVGAGFEQVLTR
jgi:hypothetical protein